MPFKQECIDFLNLYPYNFENSCFFFYKWMQLWLFKIMHFSFLIAALIMPASHVLFPLIIFSGVYNTKPLNDIFKGETLKGHNACSIGVSNPGEVSASPEVIPENSWTVFLCF